MKFDVVCEVVQGDFSIPSGLAAVEAIVDAWPEAVICANDLIAIGVLQGLKAAGAMVPQDIAVCGFDDIGFATVCDPQLTTVRQPMKNIVEVAVGRLLDRMGGDRSPAISIRRPPKLVVRTSTVQ